MNRVIQFIKRLDFNKILVVCIIGFAFFNMPDFQLKSLEIQSEKLNKKICIQEMIPTLEVIPMEDLK